MASLSSCTSRSAAPPLHGALAAAFISGLHAAFYASMGFMALAAGLSALRAGSPQPAG